MGKIELVNCAVCQKTVSPYAHHCPTCGHPFQPEPRGPMVVVTGFDITMSDWMNLWIKSTIAMVPALLLLGVLGVFFWAILGGLLAGLLG